MEWLRSKFELNRGDGPNNVRSMEGMRGFAVFLVCLVHYMTLVRPWIAGQQCLLTIGWATHAVGNVGVDLFFVLSGYLIYGTLLARPQGFRRFILRRIRRIYPAFIAVFALYVILSQYIPSESKIPSGSGGVIYLIQNLLLLPGIFPIEPMITVTWSLSYEMFYYLAIPVVIEVLNLRKRSSAWRVYLFTTASILFALYCAICSGPVRLLMFIAGILLYEVLNGYRVSSPSDIMGAVALCIGLSSTLLPVAGTSGTAVKLAILFVSFFVFCLACFRNNGTWLASAFTWTPLRWLGNMSYSYYLLHGLVLKAVFYALDSVLAPPAYGSWIFPVMLPVMFLLTLIPTAALFIWVERPLSLTKTT